MKAQKILDRLNDPNGNSNTNEAIPYVPQIIKITKKLKEKIELISLELKVEVDLEKKKSLLYMPKWPEVVEEEKILFIPK